MTLKGLAVYLGVSEYTIRERLKKGVIPGKKDVESWWIRVEDVERYVEPNNLSTPSPMSH